MNTGPVVICSCRRFHHCAIYSPFKQTYESVVFPSQQTPTIVLSPLPKHRRMGPCHTRNEPMRGRGVPCHRWYKQIVVATLLYESLCYMKFKQCLADRRTIVCTRTFAPCAALKDYSDFGPRPCGPCGPCGPCALHPCHVVH
jgi:hypothetical protein